MACSVAHSYPIYVPRSRPGPGMAIGCPETMAFGRLANSSTALSSYHARTADYGARARSWSRIGRYTPAPHEWATYSYTPPFPLFAPTGEWGVYTWTASTVDLTSVNAFQVSLDGAIEPLDVSGSSYVTLSYDELFKGALDLGWEDTWRTFIAGSCGAGKTDQARFWSLFDAIERNAVGAQSFTALLRPVSMDGSTGALRDWLGSDTRLIDDLSEWYDERDLSSRNIKSIRHALRRALEGTDEVSLNALVTRVRETLSKEVFARVKWRSRRRPSTSKAHAASTHDWVLAFVLHTGISPPTGAVTRPSVGRALVRTTTAQQVKYETLRRRQNSANLRNPVRGWSTRARFGRSPCTHVPLSGRSQSSRCRCVGHYYPLAQCA
jgi:hypothetical protein